jgi:disulfide bond formation protein DsbB
MEATKMIQDEPSSRSARPQKLERTATYVSFEDARDTEMGHHGASARASKIVAMASILILGGVIPLAGALLSQFGFGFRPCHFCLLQRYPYVVVIAAGVLSLLVARGGVPWRLLVAVAIYALLVTATLGLIHTGIEGKWLTYTGGCVAQTPADASLEALRAAIASAPLVACDQATAVILGLSMATWNVLWALFVVLLIGLQYRFEWRRYVG